MFELNVVNDHDIPTDWLEVNRDDKLSPELNLMMWVLLDAAFLLGRRPPRSLNPESRISWERQRSEALEWFEFDDSTWLFSFVSVCAFLNLDPEAVRRQVL